MPGGFRPETTRDPPGDLRAAGFTMSRAAPAANCQNIGFLRRSNLGMPCTTTLPLFAIHHNGPCRQASGTQCIARYVSESDSDSEPVPGFLTEPGRCGRGGWGPVQNPLRLCILSKPLCRRSPEVMRCRSGAESGWDPSWGGNASRTTLHGTAGTGLPPWGWRQARPCIWTLVLMSCQTRSPV